MPVPDIEEATIIFKKSNKTAKWTSKPGVSLLKLAENAGLKPDFGCRSGMCGTCETKLLKGTTRFIHDTTEDGPEGWTDGTVLICSSVPGSKEVELDL